MSAKSAVSTHSASIQTLWLCCVVVPVCVQILPSVFGSSSNSDPIGSPMMLFVVVLAVMALASIGSVMLLSRARRTNEAELGYLGLFFFVISVWLLANAITTPGVLFEQGASSLAKAFWAVPIALVVSVPAVLHRTRAGHSADIEWRQWVSTVQYSVVAFASLLVTFPRLIPDLGPDSLVTTIVSILSVIGCAAYSHRHYQLARIGRSAAPLVVSLGYGLVGASMLMWIGAVPYSLAFWISHFLIMCGAIAATIGALSVYRLTDHVRPYFEPIIDIDPRCALEVGMDPSVHTFIQSLEQKDPLSAEHVIRTTELALTIGPRLGLTRLELRDLGLTALLHDIGQMVIPEAILKKPGKLEDHEYEIVKRHAQYGAEIVAASPALKSIAPAIRAHHERIDGSGYPLGLVGPKVPLLARIVSVCDAFDALSNTRQYRPSIDREAAIEVLERYAGSQWDRRVVDTLVRTVRSNPPSEMPERLDLAGHIGCDCIPQLKAS